MGLLDYFASSRPKGGNATLAKERLQILVAHDRVARDKPSYLPQLQQEILAVIRKYVEVDMDAVSVTYEQEESHEVLELNIILPESASTSGA
ncbi:cell division topological specificity factor MinE [Allochromatium palmeri]|uniref:Cell division topological specificity factor n=1 Tax=Allochromatium palmeri TaxID=231048 RepID=A0A6N8EB28_9GAMM|nr:cell division topological specificity factor MinE [Allochromatium palmeri]MTW19856.1 cell division topological specificity factor MinE [Allochromatium palmeri]